MLNKHLVLKTKKKERKKKKPENFRRVYEIRKIPTSRLIGKRKKKRNKIHKKLGETYLKGIARYTEALEEERPSKFR